MSPYDEDWLRTEETIEPPDCDDYSTETGLELSKLSDILLETREPWPPSEEWTRRLRAVLAEVEGAQRSARGDDPPDSGESLGLETRGGAR